MNRCKRSHHICQILFTNNSLLFNVSHWRCWLYSTLNIIVAWYNIIDVCCNYPLRLTIFLSLIQLLCRIYIRCVTMYLTVHQRVTFLIDYGVHDYGDVSGAPQNKMKNKYCSTHSAEHIAGTVMRIDKKILVLNKNKT